MLRLGSKYQIFNVDKMDIFRLVKIKNCNKYVFESEDGKTEMTFDKEKADALVELTPDAILDIMVTSYEDGMNDVYACVYRTNDIATDMNKPCVVLRQDIYSFLKNAMMVNNNTILVGECENIYSLQQNQDIMELFEFDKVDFNITISLYTDDTIDNIFRSIPSKRLRDIDAVLAELSKKNNEQIKGYCSSLRQLFEENDFIDRFREVFNIVSIDFPIILGKESYNSEGDIILNSKQKKRLEDMLRKYITDIRVVEYAYDVDVSAIVKYKHIMVSDVNQKIYLIAYTETGSYPVDDDIAQAMGIM